MASDDDSQDSKTVKVKLFTSKLCRICKETHDDKHYSVTSVEKDSEICYNFNLSEDTDCMVKHICRKCYKKLKKVISSLKHTKKSDHDESLIRFLSESLLPAILPSMLEMNVGTNSKRKLQCCSLCKLPGHKKGSNDCPLSSVEVRSPVKK